MLAKHKHFFYLMPIFISIVACSCAVNIIPLPHTETEVPSVEGHLTECGKSVANKTVTFNWIREDGVWRYTAETTTSSDGYFYFPEKRGFHLVKVLVIVADCGYKYRLAIKDSDAERLLAVGMFFGPCYDMPKHLTIDCELTKSGEDCCEFSDTPLWSNYIGYGVPWE